jgi:hypothetical protein
MSMSWNDLMLPLFPLKNKKKNYMYIYIEIVNHRKKASHLPRFWYWLSHSAIKSINYFVSRFISLTSGKFFYLFIFHFNEELFKVNRIMLMVLIAIIRNRLSELKIFQLFYFSTFKIAMSISKSNLQGSRSTHIIRTSKEKFFCFLTKKLTTYWRGSFHAL